MKRSFEGAAFNIGGCRRCWGTSSSCCWLRLISFISPVSFLKHWHFISLFHFILSLFLYLFVSFFCFLLLLPVPASVPCEFNESVDEIKRLIDANSESDPIKTGAGVWIIWNSERIWDRSELMTDAMCFNWIQSDGIKGSRRLTKTGGRPVSWASRAATRWETLWASSASITTWAFAI